MEISARKILAITAVVSFLISSIAGFIFGAAGSAYLTKFFPQLAGQSNNIKNTVNSNSAGDNKIILADNPQNGDLGAVGAIKKASPAVVSIIISKDLPKYQSYNPFGNDPFFQQFFGNDFSAPQDSGSGTQKKEIGGGSGFIISSDGLIVTNKHVVNDKSADYTVLMNDGEKKYPAKVLAIDPANDIALIKIDGKDLPIVTLGDSGSLEVGQSVITIGNALGEFKNTAGEGIISGLSRSIIASGSGSGAERLIDLIQTDAIVNPGNSGGPLINLKGEVIGINVAMAQGAENIGFSIPINDAKKAINDVKITGRIVSPYVGVRYVLINEDIKSKNNLSVDYGALVARGNTIGDLAVIPGSPADKAGILENDIILEVDGVKIDENNPLANAVSKHSVGDTLSFKIMSKGKEKTVKITLEERKAQ